MNLEKSRTFISTGQVVIYDVTISISKVIIHNKQYQNVYGDMNLVGRLSNLRALILPRYQLSLFLAVYVLYEVEHVKHCISRNF